MALHMTLHKSSLYIYLTIFNTCSYSNKDFCCNNISPVPGILVCFISGKYLNWSQLAMVGATIPIPFIVSMFLIPETPRWYISKDKKKSARKALQWLRGRDTDVSQEYSEIGKNHREQQLDDGSEGIGDLFSYRYMKPLLISLGLMLFQQMSGINAVMFYTVDIFEVRFNAATIPLFVTF